MTRESANVGRGLRPALMVAVLLCAPAAKADTAAKVVVTSKPAHSIAAAVMQGISVPALLIEGSASPHTYAMKPSDAQKVNDAHLFIRISEALEPFTAKLVKALPARVETLTLAEAGGVGLLARRTGGTFETQAHGGKGHAHGSQAEKGSKDSHDPHIWLDPRNAKAMAAAIGQALARRVPGRAELIAANVADFGARIDKASGEIEAVLKPIAGRPFVVFHDSMQYFEQRFGLPAAGSITVSPDVQPSAKRLSELRAKLMSLSAACVFSEPGLQQKVIASVTEGTRARSGVLDPEGLALEPGPGLYVALIQGLAREMRSCLDEATARG